MEYEASLVRRQVWRVDKFAENVNATRRVIAFQRKTVN